MIVAILDDLGLHHTLPPLEPSGNTATPSGVVRRSRRGRRDTSPPAFFDPADKLRNNFARSWLSFQFGLDGLLGLTPGVTRRSHYRGFRPGPTRRFVESLSFVGRATR